MERIIKKINNAYYMIYTLTILSTIVGYLVTQTREAVDVKSPLSITLSSIVIIYIFISLPAAITIFHRSTKKWAAIEDDFKKFEKYSAGATWRILAVGFGLVLSVVAFYFIRTESMIFCAGITAIALLYCKPTIGKIRSDLKMDEPEDEEEISE
jgi:hypothetical protein